MTGNAETDIDIGYIPQALNEITAYLRQAANTGAPQEERASYRRAATISCDALSQLADHDQLWDRLDDDYRRRIQSWRDLEVPAFARLLEALGYSGTTPAVELISDANQQLRQAAGISLENDPVSAARQAVTWLRDEVCAGRNAAYRAQRKRWLVGVRNTLTGAFTAAVVLPELQDYISNLNLDHEVVQLARDLVDRAGTALSSVSFGLVAIPKAVARMPGFPPRATRAEAGQGPPVQPSGPTAWPAVSAPGGQAQSLADTLLGPQQEAWPITPTPKGPDPDPPAQPPTHGPGGQPRGPANPP